MENHSKSTYLGIIDLGSNSFNLIIAQNSEIFKPIIKRFNITVQLAKYLGDDNILSSQGIEKCCEALAAMQEFIKPLSDQIEIKANATYTIRNTKNIKELLTEIQKVFPHKINIISGEQEALKIFRGICISHPINEKFIALDIGGGSTELVFSENLEPKFYKSQNLGCVSFSHKYFSNGILDRKTFDLAHQRACELFATAHQKAQELGFLGCELAVGSSGTVKNSLLIVKTLFKEVEKNFCIAIDNHNNKTEILDQPTLDLIKTQLASINDYKKHNPAPDCLTKSDLDFIEDLVFAWTKTDDLLKYGFDASGRNVFVGGLAVLKALFTTLELKTLIYSDTALREGILYEECSTEQIKNLKQTTIDFLEQKYKVNPFILSELSEITYALTSSNELPFNRQDIKNFCIFNLLGMFIDEDNFARHSQYIFKNSKIYGFTPKEMAEIEMVLTQYNSVAARNGDKYTCVALFMTFAFFFISSDIKDLILNKNIEVHYKNRTSLEVICNKEIFNKYGYIRETFNRMSRKINKSSLTISVILK